MTTYCAPCLADLALVRDAVTAVSGTAACVAHAVLLTHPGDTPQRRLSRLSELRDMAESKLPTASPEDAARIELLVQEYALAGAMDMTVPLKDLAGDRTPRPPKKRNRGRDRDRPDRGPRPERADQQGGAAGASEESPGGAGAGAQVQPAGDVTPGPEATAPQAVPAEPAPADASSPAPAPSEPAAPAPSEPAAPAAPEPQAAPSSEAPVAE